MPPGKFLKFWCKMVQSEAFWGHISTSLSSSPAGYTYTRADRRSIGRAANWIYSPTVECVWFTKWFLLSPQFSIHPTVCPWVFKPFTPKSDQCQISPAASPEILHHTVWRTWLFIAYQVDKWSYYQFSLHHSYVSLLKGWENVLLELGSERVKDVFELGESYSNVPENSKKSI